MINSDGYGICRLCGETRKLTFEHIPPRAAFNDAQVFIQNHENLFEEGSYLYGKRRSSHRGMGRQSLCESCQTKTGGWYAKHYVEFARQAAVLIHRDFKKSPFDHCYQIQPLEVLKQALVMFASTESSRTLLDRPEYRRYLLDPYNTQFPSDFRVYLYYTLSSTHRMNGRAMVADGARVSHCAEISFHPIGLVLSFNKTPPHQAMVDITDFSSCAPMERKSVHVSPPVLEVSTVCTGTYGRGGQLEKAHH